MAAVSAMRDCSQVSNLKGDVRANGKRLYDYVISRKKSGGWEERKDVVWVRKRRDKKRET